MKETSRSMGRRLRVVCVVAVCLGATLLFLLMAATSLQPGPNEDLPTGSDSGGISQNGNELHIKSHLTLPHGTPLQVEDLELHILTAVHDPDFPAKNGFNVFLNGWIRYDTKSDFVCCLLRSEGGTMISAKAYTYHIYDMFLVNLQQAEFSCSLSEEQVRSVGGAGFKFITFAEYSCWDAPDTMLEILFPERKVDAVGLCPKVLYGNLDPYRLIEWFEYARLMNVTKVFGYHADLEPAPKRILDYYSSTGFLETYPLYAPTRKGGPKASFTPPRDEHQAWTHEVTAVNDCKLRMSGFDYVIIMDVDEVMVPKDKASVVENGGGNYLSILKKSSQHYPDAGGFLFSSFVMLLDWGESRSSPLFLTSYVKRSKRWNISTKDQEQRCALVPQRTFFALNNYVINRNEWKTYDVPSDLYTLLHFRSCKKWSWRGCDSLNRVHDASLVPYERSLVKNILKLPLFAITGDRTVQNKLSKWYDHIQKEEG